MAKLYRQIVDQIKKHRKPVTVSNSTDHFQLLDLAEEIKQRATKCLDWPSNSSFSTCFVLLRIRESIQSIVCLLSLGLGEDAITIARKAIEMSIVLAYALAMNEMQDLRDGIGKYKRVNYKDICTKMPGDAGELVYELYKVLSGYTHLSNTIAKSTTSELDIIVDPKAIGMDANTQDWAEKLNHQFNPIIRQFLFMLVDLYIHEKGESLEAYRLKVLSRKLMYLGFKHKKLGDIIVSTGLADPSSFFEKYNDLLIKEKILNEDNSPGQSIIQEMKDEFRQVMRVWNKDNLEDLESEFEELGL